MPAFDQFANNATTTLNGAITNVATTMTVAAFSTFPTAVTGVTQFRVLIDTELILVTNVATTTWTISRGAEGTTGAAHSTGATVTHIVSAAALAGLISDAVQIPYSSRYRGSTQSIGNNSPTIVAYPTIDGAENDISYSVGVWTITRAGVYIFDNTISFANNNTNRRELRHHINGVQIDVASLVVPSSGAADHVLNLATVKRLAVGDTIDSRAYQNTGAGLNLQAGIEATNCNVARIGT